ncbi:AAA family ATPase [Sphingomonas sp. HF-S3]|uniref:non-specific protein-tyrosine kinase n=1 Tax=Sphingomonas rustica TaxID=3103142 RepID=A0ABV0BDD3_9SPHN
MEVRQDTAYEARLADIIAAVRDTLRRRWLVLTIVTALIVVAGVVVVYQMTPLYSSQARIRIDPSRDPLSKAADARTELSAEAIETEVTAMYSLDLARQVVRKLNLMNDPEFAGALLNSDNAKVLNSAQRETTVANAVLSKLGVYREGQTYVLGVSYVSRDPVKAAAIANMFAELYISGRVGDKTGTATQQAQWFERRLAEMGEEVRKADAAVAQYRAQSGLLQSTASGVGTIADQQVAPLAGSLAAADSEAAAARANYSSARAQVARGGLESVSEVLNSGVIADLKRQRTEVMRNKGEIEARYGSRHPESIKIREQLESIDVAIAAEARRVLGSLQAASASADARAASLRKTLNELDGKRALDARNTVAIEGLEREAAGKRAQYDSLSQQALASVQASRNSMSQAAIIDRAEPARAPSSPNKPLLIALALVAGLAAGASTITVQELMSGGLRTSDEVESQLGIPLLAAVPRETAPNPADLLIERPTSYFAEAYRIARAALLGNKEGLSQIIAITSSVPSEGKTTTALAFARTLAIAGSKTLLIECDVRRAAMRRLVKQEPTRGGIVEVLQGSATLADTMTQGDVPNLDHLLAQTPYYTSENLFGSGTMEQLLKEVRGRYQHIVLDLPPLIGLADSRALAVMADMTLMVVKWEDTPGKVAAQALSMLQGDGANPVGVILTMVDSSADVVGGKYYSRKYSDYYQAA